MLKKRAKIILLLAFIFTGNLTLPVLAASFSPEIKIEKYFDEKSGREVEVAAGEIIVQFKPRVSAQAVLQNKPIKIIKTLPGRAQVFSLSEKSPAITVKKLLEEYRKDPNVEYAEPNYIIDLLSETPNDPLYPQQWGLKQIKAAEAWEMSGEKQGVVVAVIDTGVSLFHQDLKNNIWHNPTDDSNGWNFSDDNNYPVDENGHGTHVAGIIAAETNNGLGVAGVDPNGRIMSLRIFNAKGQARSSDLIFAIYYAAENGAKVINLSLGTRSFSSLLNQAVQYAHEKGCVLVAAVGNDGDGTVVYPAAYDNVLAVAAVDKNDERSFYSNYNAYVDLAAPGGDGKPGNAGNVYSCYRNDTYAYLSGTSMAAPFVAGLAAFIWEQDPTLTNAQVEKIIFSSADDLGTPGRDDYFGYGRINMRKAFEALRANISDPTPPVGTLLINGGKKYIGSREVTLTLIATDEESGMGPGAQMKFSNDNLNWSAAEDYVSTKSWILSLGEGAKTVYLKLKNPSGVWMRKPVSATAYLLSHEYAGGLRMVAMPFHSLQGEAISGNPSLLRWEDGDFKNVTSFEPGKGYFARIKEPASVNFGNLSAVDDAKDFEISLEPSWNQIGSPFLFNVPWKGVKVKDGQSGAILSMAEAVERGWIKNGLWKFNGSANELTDVLEPWQGYWVKASRKLSLIVPPVAAAVSSPASQEKPVDEWELQILAAGQGGEQKSIAYFGVSAQAEDAAGDTFDVEAPPPFSAGIELYFPSGQNKLAVETKKPVANQKVWDFKVKMASADSLNLQVQNMDQLPVGLNCSLTDVANNRTVDLRENNVYVFFAEPDREYDFKITVSDVKLHSPLNVSRALNYPNPFNPYITATTIKFSLSKNSDINIRIYDIAGLLVRALDQAACTEGVNTVVWDGKDAAGNVLPNGVYFYLIKARDFVGNENFFKGKMAIWK